MPTITRQVRVVQKYRVSQDEQNAGSSMQLVQQLLHNLLKIVCYPYGLVPRLSSAVLIVALSLSSSSLQCLHFTSLKCQQGDHSLSSHPRRHRRLRLLWLRCFWFWPHAIVADAAVVPSAGVGCATYTCPAEGAFSGLTVATEKEAARQGKSALVVHVKLGQMVTGK